MIQFYGPSVAVTGELTADETAHCVRVLRKQPGDEIVVVDGRGNRHVCRIVSITKKGMSVEILSSEVIARHWGAPITLAIAPTKNADRMEWLVEKIVELGIDRIVLLECERSERRRMRTERLEKIMISAMKQSLKASIPDLIGPMTFSEFIQNETYGNGMRFIAHCVEDRPRELLCGALAKIGENLFATPVTILIGPEGDFSPKEIESAFDAAYRPVSLGDSRLRTETAALYSVAAVHALRQAYEVGSPGLSSGENAFQP